MNKYSLREHLQKALEPFASTLKCTSFDEENNAYLCQDEGTLQVYNFDAYVGACCPHPLPASPDAIHIGSKDLYFVEFKNQRPADVDKTQMQRKFEAGTKILKDLLKDFSAKDCRYHFCVVMKNQPRPRFMDFRHIEKSAVRFGLDELNQKLGRFYDHVVTENIDFYVKKFKDLQCA